MIEEAIDQRKFRDALGQFATGVTIITTLTKGGEPEGLTVNSFSSLSLNPAMILWSLSNDTPVLGVFLECERFAVNVLAADQQHLSDRFASSINNRFDNLDWYSGVNGVPLIPNCLAYFECCKAACHEGGDHHIIVGGVDRFKYSEGRPLIYFGGQYGVPCDGTGKIVGNRGRRI